METQANSRILKRLGALLIAVGLIDILVMFYCITSQRFYFSSFNIFSVIAGALLWKGSLRTASIVQTFAAFFLGAAAASVVAFIFLFPLDLIIAYLRINTGYFVISVVVMASLLAMLTVVIRTLSSVSVQVAIINEGVERWSVRDRLVAGAVLVLAASVFSKFMLSSGEAEHAKAIAEQQTGPGYKYYVSSLKTLAGSDGTVYKASVTAWNELEIKQIPIEWRE